MGSFNLSAWAVRHRALMLFLMIALGIAGAASYMQLGRAEDPNFTIKIANITAVWPGATTQEMQAQVSDRSKRSCRSCPSSSACRPTPSPASWRRRWCSATIRART
jgi:multidrug efflux pump